MSTIPPGFKQTEVGTIPDEWCAEPLGQLVDFENGDRGKNYPSGADFVDDGHPFINAGHLRGKSIEGTNFDYITTGKMSQLRSGKYKFGDILFCLRGSLGKFGQVGNTTPLGAIASSLIIVRPKAKRATTAFLCQYFSSWLCDNSIDLWAGGAAQPNLGGQDLARFLVPLPPIPEQSAIAEALGDADALIEGLEALIAKKRDIKQGAMQELLTGDRRLPGFQGVWLEINLAKLSHLKARIGWQGLTTEEYLSSGDYYLVTGTDFVDGRVDWERCCFVERERFVQDPNIQIRPGDILLTKDGTIGKVGFVDHLPGPATLNSGIFVIRPKNAGYEPLFVYYVLCSSIFDVFLNRLQAGSTIVHLYQKDVAHFQFKAPPAEEQRAIAAVLADMDAEIAALEDKLAKAHAVKQGMMQVLLTGEIRLI